MLWVRSLWPFVMTPLTPHVLDWVPSDNPRTKSKTLENKIGLEVKWLFLLIIEIHTVNMVVLNYLPI